MRRIARLIAPIALLMVATVLPASAQGTLPPHAWLFGTWTGGLFPPPSAIGAQECLAQPVVIFTRDVVMRASIIDQIYLQRLIESARVTSTGVEFHFLQSSPMATTSPFGLSSDSVAATGFGCENPDVLHVQRRGDNEISFPGCADFPYPLVRCSGR